MLKSKEYLTELAVKCLSKAKSCGATDVEVSLGNSISENINFREKKIEYSERSEVLSLGLTTYIEKKKSNVSTSNFDEANLETLVERCVQCTKVSPDDKYVGLGDEDIFEKTALDLDLYDEKHLTSNFKKEFLEEVENAVFSVPQIKNSNGSSFSENKSNFILANSKGFCNGYKSSSFTVFCEALAELNGQMERDYEISVSRFAEDLSKPNIIGLEAAKKACKRLGAKKIKSGKMAVIFDKRVARSLLSTFSSAISGSAFARGTSFLKDSLNKKIFTKDINIIDNPLIKKGMGSQLFDSEGAKNERLTLVSGGVLKELFLDSYNARILRMESNGRCGGSTNLYIDNGSIDLKKMISDQKKAFFVTELIGRAGDITNGNYSVGASGIMIENGEFAYAVNEVTIASNLVDMFKNLIPMNDLELKTSTNSPSIMIDTMTVAGK